MEEQNEINVYSVLSEKSKKIAPQIEELLNGLTVDEAIRLLGRVRISITKKSKIEISA